MDKELKNKELEQVSGGSIKFDPEEPQFDPEPSSQLKPLPKPKPSPFPSPCELICDMRNEGTEACELDGKGKLIQCSGCRNNHD